MPRITITKEANAAIRSASTKEFIDTSVKNDDGTFTFDIGDDVYERLIEASQPGESISDTIIRIVALHHSEGKLN